MTPFNAEAKTQLSVIQALFDEMESLYRDLESYFCFDQKQYPLHSFMKDIKTFKDQFKVRSKILRKKVFLISIIKGLKFESS